MQILTRLNQVISHSEHEYIPVGSSAVCPVTGECHNDVLIVTVDSVPTDIDHYNYYYIDGKFIKGSNNSTLREINHNRKLRFWFGTRDEYAALEEKFEDCYYIISDGEDDSDVMDAISNLSDLLEEVVGGVVPVEKANQATFAEKAPRKGENENGDAYDEEVGKAFTFKNTNGFGSDDPYAKGYWRVHSFKDDEDGNYYTAFTPSYSGKQMLGSDIKPIKRVYVYQLGTSLKKVKSAHIESAYIDNLFGENGDSIYERINNACSMNENFGKIEDTVNVFDSSDVAQTKNALFVDGSGLYEMRILADIEGKGMSSYNLGLVRVVTGEGVSTYATASNGINTYTLQFKRRVEDGKYYVKLWVDGKEDMAGVTGTMDLCYRKIMQT